MTTQSDHDARTPEERLLSKKRLGSFYLDDVRALIAERDNALRLAGSDYEECATERDIARGRAEAAEAENRRLTEGLRDLESAVRILEVMLREPAAEGLMSAEDYRAYLSGAWLGVDEAVEKARALLSASPTDGGRMLVSVNHASNPTDILGKSAICPDCGNALLIATVPPDGGGAK